MQNRLIGRDRSIIVAADVENVYECGRLAEALKGVPGISAFKLGFEVGLDGLAQADHAVRKNFGEDVTTIYDHQKAGNDIPEMGPKFARKIKRAGCSAAILFPFAGPETQRRWTDSCNEAGLRVIVGGVMTHQKFLVSEGGYISNDAPERIFKLACEQGVRDFVVPGTKIEWVKRLRSLLEAEVGEGEFDLYAPGFITQGGDITECGAAAGPRFHAIVGSAIYGKSTQQDRRAAALQMTSKLAA